MNIKDLGQLVSLMTKLPSMDKIKEEAERMQQRLAEITAEGDAGAGMVKVRINGRMEILQCQISSEALADKEMLEDLIAAAVNQAIARVRQLTAEETGKMASNLGIPAGMNIPGLQLPGS
jgi:nucleoid-associated protein EbfC